VGENAFFVGEGTVGEGKETSGGVERGMIKESDGGSAEGEEGSQGYRPAREPFEGKRGGEGAGGKGVKQENQRDAGLLEI